MTLQQAARRVSVRSSTPASRCCVILGAAFAKKFIQPVGLDGASHMGQYTFRVLCETRHIWVPPVRNQAAESLRRDRKISDPR